MFLHYTGRRVGEAVAMTPGQIDGTRVTFGKTKNGKPAVAVMPKPVAELVAALDPVDGKVFGYAHRSSLYATLRRAARKAGVDYLPTHQLGRHSFATALDNAGWTSKQIADAGGWESAALVQKAYVHTTDTQEKAAKQLGKVLAKRKKV